MHTLPVAHVGVQLGVDKENVGQFLLRRWLLKEKVFLQTAVDILDDLSPQFFVIPQRLPRGLGVAQEVRSDLVQ